MEVPYVDIGAQYRENRDEILEAVDKLLASGQYIMGPELETFEEKFSKLCGVKHAIGVADGTDALIISMKVLNIGEGDEVITAPNSWISSASAIALIGAKPVFVDINEDQNMDPSLLEAAITPKTKAIMPVHLTGKIADMNPILEIAKKHGLYVIEDAAQSVGARYHGKASGAMGTTGCFSLHPLKNLNGCGDGGVITTNDDALAEKIKLWRNHGIKSREEIVHWGYNSRLDCIQAAILNIRIEQLDKVSEKRRRNAQLYRENMPKGIKCPVDDKDCFDVYHLFVIQVDRRDELKAFLQESGISTAVHYPTPIHLYEAASYLGHKTGDFPKTEEQSTRILSLPIHQGLDEEQILYVCEKIKEFYS